MLISTDIHNKKLLQKQKNYCSRLLQNFEILRGKFFAMPFFSLYSSHTSNLAHKRVAENPRGVFKSTHVNTKNNCIHVLCKNDFEFFPLAGRYVA